MQISGEFSGKNKKWKERSASARLLQEKVARGDLNLHRIFMLSDRPIAPEGCLYDVWNVNNLL